MNDPELVDEARRWLRFAAEDIDVAQIVDHLTTPALMRV